jgi:DNA modification methylase
MTPSLQIPDAKNPLLILQGDTRELIRNIPDETFQCVITSPPYWGLRDYGYKQQIGAEKNLADYIQTLTDIFREIRRTLKKEGTLWLNMGNTYASTGHTYRHKGNRNLGSAMDWRPNTPKGLKPKDLIGLAWMLALACQTDGWYLRNDIIWHKPNKLPEPVKDRMTTSHEYLFLMTKSKKYYFNHEAIKEPSANGNGMKSRRTVWNINTEAYKEAHFAAFPKKLVQPCILAGSKENDLILDPFFGSGTTGEVALSLKRRCIGMEANPNYIKLCQRRTAHVQTQLLV